ncbi:MAG: TetR/AcrR family transcriptional regulator [Acidimicrobiia bacterium]
MTATAAAKTEAKLAAADAKRTAKLAAADAKLAAAPAKIDAKTAAASAKLAAADAALKATGATAAAALGRVAAHLDALDLWTRTEPGARKPRLGRAELASVAIRVADAEGIDAVSMRRIATELDVGTMTLYHYVRTKDELLALMVDALLGEVVVPAGDELPGEWRAAITVIARRSRDALLRHPWVLDVSGDPSIGPNAMRHFDQCWQAVRGLDADLETKLDVITAVDDYVFGFCLHEQRALGEGGDATAMLGYMERLLEVGDYPALRELTDELGLGAFWERLHAHATASARFERNLERLLAGFATALD